MLPSSFEKVLPVFLSKALSDDPSGQALVDFWDNITDTIKDEILELYYVKRPERIPSRWLNILGEYLSADLLNIDSDFTKRYKILKSIETHKKRGTWIDDAKNRIDAVTSLDAAIFHAQDSDDSIELGQQLNDPDFYWSTEGAQDGVDDKLGTWEVGDFTEYVITGNVYIDCHSGINVSTLTADQISKIVMNLETDVAPAYMRVYLGYVNATGQFIKYAGGVIE